MRSLLRGGFALETALTLVLFCLVGCGGGGSDPQHSPTIVSITPSQGPASGGTTVEINGTDFADGLTVTFGGVSATGIEVVDANNLRCVTAAHAAGLVDVIVAWRASYGNVAVDGYEFLPGPEVTTIVPVVGTEDGGTAVTLTGTNFEPGALVYFDSSLAVNVIVNGTGTQLDCDTPVHATELVDITILNPSGGGTLESDAYTFVPEPTITAVTPAVGGTAGGTLVYLDGTGFASTGIVEFDGTPATQVTVHSSTLISCRPAAHATGAVDVRVENAVGVDDTLTGGFVYSDSAPPYVSSVTAPTGPRDTATSVTISGTGFAAGPTVTFDGVAATVVVLVDANTITCDTPVPGKGGPADVTVTNTDGQSDTLEGGFTYWPRWVVTANLDSGSVSMMALDEDEGTLTCESVESVLGPTRIDAGDGYVFVSHSAGVSMYSIDQETGALSLEQTASTGGTTPLAVLYEPGAPRLYVTNYGSNTIAVFDVDTVGATLTPVSGSPFSSVGFGPVALSIDVGSPMLFVCNRDSETLVSLDIGGGGALSLNALAQPPAPTGSDPRAIVFARPGLRRVYCLNYGDNTISVFRVDGNGLFTEMPSSPALGEGNVVSAAEGLLFDAANDMLMAVNQSPPSVSVFYVRSTGRLAEMDESPFATGGSAPLAITMVDDWVLTTQAGSDGVASQEYDSGGLFDLTTVDGSPFDSVGPMPVDIAADD